jgi:hypothetical protein
MFRAFRRLVGRVVGTFALVLATQLTYAGQVDLAVLSGGAAPAAAYDVADTDGASGADCASQPCCGAGAMNALTCAATAYGVDAAVSASTPITDLLRPSPAAFSPQSPLFRRRDATRPPPRCDHFRRPISCSAAS